MAWCVFLVRVVLIQWEVEIATPVGSHVYTCTERPWDVTPSGSHVGNKNKQPWIQSNRLAWEVSFSKCHTKKYVVFSLWAKKGNCFVISSRNWSFCWTFAIWINLDSFLPCGAVWKTLEPCLECFNKNLHKQYSGKFHKAVDAISFIPFLSDCSNCSSLLISIVALCSAWLAFFF